MSAYTAASLAGPYTGTRTVSAEDGKLAIAKVRAWVRREMALPMHADSSCLIGTGVRRLPVARARRAAQ